MRDQQHKDAIAAIASDDSLSTPQKRVKAGKLTRETAQGLKDEGKTNLEIAELLGLDESSVRKIIRPS
jgi:DNA-binding NarL/FixJ family response regulator